MAILVISIQHDLATDDPMVTESRRGICRPPHALQPRSAFNIMFAIDEVKKVYPNADYRHLTLVGHSNGGDISMFFAKQHSDLVKKVVTLDNPWVPLPHRRQGEDPVVPLPRTTSSSLIPASWPR